MSYVRGVGFFRAASLGFRNYADFGGRAQRSEYWWFQLFVVVVSVILAIVGQGALDWSEEKQGLSQSLWSLATLIPTLSLGWRRMHDLGKSGWWNFLPVAPLLWTIIAAFILSEMGETEEPIIVAGGVLGLVATAASFIYVIILLARDSDPRPNRYGPSPKYSEADEVFR